MRSLPGIVGQCVGHREADYSVESDCPFVAMVVHKSGGGHK
jgi:hypothetical protein